MKAQETGPQQLRAVVDQVLGSMVFSDRPDLAEGYVSRLRILDALQAAPDAPSITVGTRDLQLTLKTPSGADWDREVKEAVRSGCVAGALLFVMYQMHVNGANEPSMNKAMRDVYAEWSLGRCFGDGRPLPRSKQSMQDAWNRHGGVAHFWAALEASKFDPSPYSCTRREVFKSDQGFTEFLGVARAIGDFATGFMVKRVKPPRPLVDLSRFVAVPLDVPAVRLNQRPV